MNMGDGADKIGTVCDQLAGACWDGSEIPAESLEGPAGTGKNLGCPAELLAPLTVISMIQKLKIHEIIAKDELHPRVKLSEPTIDDYARVMKGGTELQPIVVFHDEDPLG
ncbi:MAG: hypothetical protein ACLQNE_31215 [Thermoguttaceae bacterium]